MERTSILCGLVLCVVSLVSGVMAPSKTIVSFAPMLAGIPIFFLGVVALNPHRRRASMGFALAVAALGSAYALATFVHSYGDKNAMPEFERWVSAIMFVPLVLFCGIVWYFMRGYSAPVKKGSPPVNKGSSPVNKGSSPSSYAEAVSSDQEALVASTKSNLGHNDFSTPHSD